MGIMEATTFSWVWGPDLELGGEAGKGPTPACPVVSSLSSWAPFGRTMRRETEGTGAQPLPSCPPGSPHVGLSVHEWKPTQGGSHWLGALLWPRPLS